MIIFRDYLNCLHFFLTDRVKTIKFKGIGYNKIEINNKTNDLMIQFDSELFLKDVLNDFELEFGEYKEITDGYLIEIINEIIDEKNEVEIAAASIDLYKCEICGSNADYELLEDNISLCKDCFRVIKKFCNFVKNK